jgi:hypothetical protein
MIIAVFTLVGVIWGVKLAIEETIGTQRTLLSRITSDTAISGFYGPGAWWAWLITLGMTHGHAGMALLMKGNLLDEWDYDLIGATGYIIAASIDLIKKSRVIAELGDAASESPLLPALVCAERAVAIGAGSSIFSLLTSLIGWPNARRSGITLIALIFTLVASFSALHAHEIISNSTPVLWCRVHNGVELGKREIPFSAIDFPAWVSDGAGAMLNFYAMRSFWKWAGWLGAVLAALALIGNVIEGFTQGGTEKIKKYLGPYFFKPTLSSDPPYHVTSK